MAKYLKSLSWDGDVSLIPEIPVGSDFITSTNTNPQTLLGYGTWTLIDKQFKNRTVANALTPSENFENEPSGAAYANRAILQDHSIIITLQLVNLVAIPDDPSTLIGKISKSRLGVDRTPTSWHFVGYSDEGDALIATNAEYDATDLKLTINDVVVKGGATEIPANSLVRFYIAIPVQPEYMLDWACDKFYWKRDA